MGKKGKKDSQNYDDFYDDEVYNDMQSQSIEFGATDAEQGTPVQEEGAEENGDNDGDFLSSIRSSKKKKEDKVEEEKSKSKDAPKLLSKKEKEKLKKDAEKQKKKEQANKKKEQQASIKQQQTEEAKSKNEAAETDKTAGEQASKQESEKDKATAKANSKKGGKKVPAGLAALKRQLELKKQQDEEKRRIEEEEELLAQEEEKLAAEDEAREEAEREAKKEREKLKREQLKAEGKLLTKKQKEEKKLQERRREQLLQSNVSVAGLQDQQEKPKRVVYDKKKSTKPKPLTEKQEHAKESIKKEDNKTKEDEVDSWEKLAEDDEPVEESWENALSDEEKEVKKEELIPEKTTPEKKVEVDSKKSALPVKEEKKVDHESVRDVTRTPTPREASPQVREPKPSADIKNKSVQNAKKAAVSGQELRSPICCILGHVDTGKTKLLDKVRQTNVQGGEAGGITQQIGATYFAIDSIKQKTATMAQFEKQTFEVPGLLVIDTPGHESFTNLRSRGSSLCNIAILVVDIMHGLEQQTLESLRLLRDRKTPFVVALNKVDRLYDWQAIPNNAFRDSIAKQSKAVQSEFQTRLDQIKLGLAEQGLNSALYYENKNMAKYVSIVPTSAVSGEGTPDLLWLLLELTQKRMSKQLRYLSEVQATILEVKVVEGFGYTIDVVLSNGVLREGDRIVLCGLNGPIATNIRAILTPPPSRELRIKSEYVHNKEVKAALGVKLAANDLEKAVAGSRLLVVGENDDEEEFMEEVMDDLTGLLDLIDTSGKGVVVQASTLGSLEALLEFLKDLKIPVMSIGLGPVYRRDVMKATTMLERAPEYAVMLCFDVKVDKEAEQFAAEQNIKIFNANIIYHLFDAFTNYQQKLLEIRRKDFMEYAVFPCVLKTIQVINKRNPMIVGVDVVEGCLRIGTPICAVHRDPSTSQPNIMILGRVQSLEVNHKSIDSIKKGQTAAGVAMRLENPSAAQPTWGRHVSESDPLYSLITRKSIDTLKDTAFRDNVSREDWLLIKKLKPIFDIK